MEFGWLQSLAYGLLSGLTEILPVSADAHRILLTHMMGISGGESVLRFAALLGSFLALVLSCRPRIAKLSREKRIASMPRNRRRRQPDFDSLSDVKLLKAAALPMVLAALACFLIGERTIRLWVLCLLTAVNGIVLMIPQYVPRGNKDSRLLSRLDAVIMGLCGILGLLPGLSRIGLVTTAGAVRGADRKYCLDFALLLSIPVLFILCLLNLYTAITAGIGTVTLIIVLKGFLTAVSAFAGTMIAVSIMRFFAFKTGYAGFAYYAWGVSVLALILYLL